MKPSNRTPVEASTIGMDAVLDDIVRVLERHNPGLPDTTRQAVAALGAAAGRLSEVQQLKIVAHKQDLPQLMSAMVEGFKPARGTFRVKPEIPVEESKGAGLGKRLSREDGRRRVEAYATPVRLEEWAGPVAGASAIREQFGTGRSTLQEWFGKGAIIGLLKGERKRVYPIEQFVDGRPMEGMSNVTKIIANPRVAWRWLITTRADGTQPLARLRQGCIAEVTAMAEGDFGAA